MFRVRSGPQIRELAYRTLKKSRGRNIIAILAIVLTTVLFTSLFSIIGGFLDQAMQMEFRSRGGNSHASVKYLDASQYEALTEAANQQGVSVYSTRLVGDLGKESLNKIVTEVRFGEDEAAQSLLAYPTEGHMPQQYYEIALSTLVLQELGVPAELGTEIPLLLIIGEQEVAVTFELCGYWQGDRISPAQQVWVSEQLADELAPIATRPFEETLDYTGVLMAEVFFSSTSNLEAKTDALMEAAGLQDLLSFGVNMAYAPMGSNPDLITIVGAVVLIGLLILSGYLIIYNIFYISISQDTQFYGLLKTIGTSGKQIKRIVRIQALALCLLGLPFGLFLGSLLGKALLPFVMTMVQVQDTGAYSVSGWMYLFAALFTVFTVYLSCIRPSRLAARVSPVEALNYSDADHSIKKTEKKTRSGSLWSMAIANLQRTRKKYILVVLSLSLSLVLVNAVYTGVSGFDKDKYIESYAVGDFYVTHYSILQPGVPYYETEYISADFLDEVASLDGLESMSSIYVEQSLQMPLEENVYQDLKARILDDIPGWQEGNEFPIFAYGVDGATAAQCEFRDGGFDADLWATGEYVIVDEMHIGYGTSEYARIYETGDTISIPDMYGQMKDYTVLAVGSIPYRMGAHFTWGTAVEIAMPEEVHAELFGVRKPLATYFYVEEEYRDQAADFVGYYTEYVDNDLTYTSRETYDEEFEQDRITFGMVGGVLSIILALVGLLNFVNTMISSIFARRRELAVLAAVGMSGRQIRKSLIFESLLYIGGAICLAVLLGSVVSYMAGEAFFTYFWSYTYHFTITPIALIAPILLLVGVCVPVLYSHQISKRSIVDRLHVD